jgi:GNAT superfamily N-acetyltransferase
MALTFHPLTPDRWPDLERLFGERGACAGCWCMWWRLDQKSWTAGKGARNKQAFRTIVASGREPGLLAYRDGIPVAWCAVEPRERYARFARARSLKPVDERPVWSVTCFFVAPAERRRGTSVALLKAAARHVRARGGTILEGYPVVPSTAAMPAAFAWTGTLRSFAAAGFREVARPSQSKAIVRLELARKTPRGG